LVEQLLSRVV